MQPSPSSRYRDVSAACSSAIRSDYSHKTTLTIKEVASELSVCDRTIKRRVQDGTFPKPIKGLGRRWIWPTAAIEKLLRQASE